MGTRDYPITDDERRWIDLWKKHGGRQHGPHTEQAYIEYHKLFEFCAALEKQVAQVWSDARAKEDEMRRILQIEN